MPLLVPVKALEDGVERIQSCAFLKYQPLVQEREKFQRMSVSKYAGLLELGVFEFCYVSFPRIFHRRCLGNCIL